MTAVLAEAQLGCVTGIFYKARHAAAETRRNTSQSSLELCDGLHSLQLLTQHSNNRSIYNISPNNLSIAPMAFNASKYVENRPHLPHPKVISRKFPSHLARFEVDKTRLKVFQCSSI